MRVDQDEVLALFRTWREDRALLRIELRLHLLAATFQVRVTRVESDQLSFMSDDKGSTLVVPLPPAADFRFLDLSRPPSTSESFGRMLMLFYPFRKDLDESNQIVFAEQREDRR